MQKFYLYKAWVILFHRHLSVLVTFFFAASSENICPIPYIVLNTARLSLLHNEILFSPSKYIGYKCYICSDLGWANFFHHHTCLHLLCFFCCIIKKYLSHILFWSHLVSVCFAMNFFFSFKIHCLQMFQLFQTRDGPIFFIVTLVYTCLHLSRFFCCMIKQYLSQILFWSQLVSVCFTMKFFSSFKIHCLQMFQLFQTRDWPIFFIVTLAYTCRAFFAAFYVSLYNILYLYK